MSYRRLPAALPLCCPAGSACNRPYARNVLNEAMATLDFAGTTLERRA